LTRKIQFLILEKTAIFTTKMPVFKKIRENNGSLLNVNGLLNFAQNRQLTDNYAKQIEMETQQNNIPVESKQIMATWRPAWGR
jgi:hypothetical protein